MAVYAIGDLQGCLDELKALLSKLNYQSGIDQLWFVGDLVNRGPQSLDTLRFIKSLPNTVITLGNHDLSLLAIAYTHRPLGKNDTIQDILDAPDREELLTWLRQQKLFHRDKELGFSMVHAGLHPSWTRSEARAYAKEVQHALRGDNYVEFFEHMYGNEPAQWSEELSGYERLRVITNILTRMRYCDKNGELNLKLKGAPGKQSKSKFMPWFDVKKRQSQKRKIIFGHWSTLGLVQRNNVYAIDTGCLWGGQLTALRIDTEVPEIIQVNAINGIKPI